MYISVFLHKDRTQPGVLILRNDHDENNAFDFSCACYGKSDNAKAAEAGNESRNPLRPFGDIPKGVWKARVVPSSGPGRVYGPHKRLLLTAVSGDALTAMSPKNADGDGDRYNILAHGGALNAAGNFRPTYGCLRLDDPDMKRLVDFIEAANLRTEIPFEIFELSISAAPAKAAAVV